MGGLTLRELINRLEELSNNGRRDGMSVQISEFQKSEYDADDLGLFSVKGAFIEQFNNGDTFDESDDSYEYVGLIIN